jgi:hypothetical protein
MEFTFYKDGSGVERVDEEFSSIEPPERRNLIAKKLGYYGEKIMRDLVSGGFLEKMYKHDLWELKFKTSPPCRAICAILGPRCLILHVLTTKKYDGAIKKKDIDIARHRFDEYTNR